MSEKLHKLQAGSVEGQVVEMGLTTTSLLSAEKFPVIVPNSFFSSQVSFPFPIFFCTFLLPLHSLQQCRVRDRERERERNKTSESHNLKSVVPTYCFFLSLTASKK